MAICEKMASEIVPCGVTMKDSLSVLEKRIDITTGVDKVKGRKILLIKYNLDFSSWNWHMRKKMTMYATDFLNDLYDPDYFFDIPDDILSTSLFLLSTLEDIYFDSVGNLIFNDSFKRGEAPCSEGQR